MHKQHGSILIEVTIALVILTLIAVGSVSYMKNRADELQMEELATWMLGVQKGVQRYLDNHSDSLTSNGLEAKTALSVPELQAAGFLPAAYPLNNKVAIRLIQEGNCQDVLCHVHGVIHTEQPLLNKKGAFDASGVAHWRQQVKGGGLIVSPQHKSWLSGGALNLANTASNFGSVLAAGTVALLASTSPEIVGYARLDPEGTIHTEQDLSTGKYLLLPHTESIDTSCAPIGAVSRGDDKKGLLVCEDGKWIRASAEGVGVEVAVFDPSTMRRFFELISGSETPERQGGYYISLELHGFATHCMARNPLTNNCSCPLGTSADLISRREIVLYNGQNSVGPFYRVVRIVLFYGCRA